MLLMLPSHLPLHAVEYRFFGLPDGRLGALDLMLWKQM